MVHYGLKEGYYMIDGQRGYVQRLLGKWHYFIVLRGWKRLRNERLEKV
jgi:hypothetical protein